MIQNYGPQALVGIQASRCRKLSRQGGVEVKKAFCGHLSGAMHFYDLAVLLYQVLKRVMHFDEYSTNQEPIIGKNLALMVVREEEN